MRRLLPLLALPAVLVAAAPAAAAPGLRAGAGYADITPPTGIPFGGWVRADRAGHGAHGRLGATVIVLERDGRRVALVAADLFAVFAGMVQDVAAAAGPGWTEENVVVGVSHTHAGPSGFANYDTYNTLAPSLETIDRPETFAELLDPKPTDRALYTFLVQRIALAVRRAAEDLGPAAAGWGASSLTSVTRNRSVEAHLHNHGLVREPGQGDAGEDPEGVEHTIDPRVDVLRVDRLERRVRRCRGAARRTRKRCVVQVRVPMGGWTMFANHGTVNPSEYQVYNEDHHGAARREFVAGVRREGEVPDRRRVVAVYANGNEGDQSAGLDQQGPVHAARVGRAEGRAMLEAWRDAGRRMHRAPALDLRWTRTCFCGRAVSTGERVADAPALGIPFLTGSEEGRGPLYDITRTPLEGVRNPSGFDSHGHKAAVPGVGGGAAPAVPLHVVRVGERLIVTLPAEPTVEVGRRAQAAAMAAVAGSGVRGAVVQGLTGDFIQYLTTPEEYDRQHYEGGSTLFGRHSGQLLWEDLGALAGRLVRGEPAPDPHPFDARNGVRPDGPAYGPGAAEGRLTAEPAERVAAGEHVRVRWHGGPRGLDRPLDDPFVTVERRAGGRWAPRTDDRDLEIVWQTDGRAAYTATWGVPGNTPAGEYRLVVTANRYRLESRPFTVTAG
jgi:neutral ceramidase